MARYAWIIDTDHLASPELGDEAGTTGPRDITEDQAVALHKRGEGARFKMYDDDGELYYSGRFLGDSESEDAFGPLDDFGTPNAGATTIKYLRNGIWEIL